MKAIAEDRGGDCLSKIYSDSKTKLRWRCGKGHVWDAIPASVIQGTWCPQCAGKGMYSIKVMKKIAKERDGDCLSDEYKNIYSRLTWKCKKGHQWEASAHSIVYSGSWCPECAGNRKYTIDDIKRIAKERGGECLSEDYKNQRQKLHWRCSNGHEWESTLNAILGGSWCQVCGGTLLTIEMMREYAKERGGECLSQEYKNAQTKLLWRCSQGHEWWAAAGPMRQHNTWCPKCSSNPPLDIEDMRQMAMILGGECLSENYKNVSEKLLWKCSKGHEFKNTAMQVRRGIWCPDCRKAMKKTRKLEELRSFANERGGKLLSNEYRDRSEKTLWECSKGHRWTARADYTKMGNWCPKCTKKIVKGTIEDMQKLAGSKGGRCLSLEYKNAHKKLVWQCSEGHVWEQTPTRVRNGAWCPQCKKQKRIASRKRSKKTSKEPPSEIKTPGSKPTSIEEMQALAKPWRGRCLSKKYIDENTELAWMCSRGHAWMATPKAIRKGRWCPECKKR